MERVIIAPYDLQCPQRFATERARLAAALGGAAAGIEHVGSTAVTGLAAKPIIDILVGLDSPPATPAQIAALATSTGARPTTPAGSPSARANPATTTCTWWPMAASSGSVTSSSATTCAVTRRCAFRNDYANVLSVTGRV